MDGKYNNLWQDLKTLSCFVFIYEKRIKHMSNNADFSNKFATASRLFKKKLQQNLRKTTSKAKINKNHAKSGATLEFTVYKVQIIDFCRHLRNSISHALIKRTQDKLWIEDKHGGRTTSSGYLDYFSVIDFLKAIIKDFK